MNNYLSALLSLSISGSLLAIILFMLKPLVKNRLRKSWQYYIWLVVLMRFLLPFSAETSLVGFFWPSAANSPSFYFNLIIPEANHEENEAMTENAFSSNNPLLSPPDVNGAKESPLPNAEAENRTIADLPIKILPYLWITFPLITVFLLLRKTVQYSCYVKFLQIGRKEMAESSVFEIYEEIRFEANAKKYIPIYINPNINTPMLAGIIKPCILLPETGFSEEEYRMIFRHELMHYKRFDILYKWFVQAAVCVHWFNPLIYFVRGEINKNCELACDEGVLSLIGTNEKRSYGDALMASVQKGIGLNNASVSITMSEDGKNLKERLESIMIFSDTSKLKRFLSLALASAIITAAFFLGFYKGTTANAAIANENEIVKIESADINPMESEIFSEKPSGENQNTQALNNFNLDELYKLVYGEIKITEQEFDNISSVYISLKNDNFKITRGGDKLFIRYGQWYDGDYTGFEIKEGQLSLFQNSPPQYISKIGNSEMASTNWLDEYLRLKGKERNKTVEIIIPESMDLNIKTDTLSGEITVEGLNIIGDYSATTASGNVDIKNSQIGGKLKINTMSGTVNALNCGISKDLTHNSASGEADFTNCTVEGDLNITSVSGSSYVKNSVFASLIMSNISGNTELILPESADNYDISYTTTTGKMTYNGGSVRNSDLRNSNASVKIVLSDISGGFKISDIKAP